MNLVHSAVEVSPMMNLFRSRSLSLISLLALLVGTGCVDGFLDIPPPPWEEQGDDDDAVQDDDDDDLGVTLSGTVVATARATGEVMSDWAYLVCAGKTVLYVTSDPNDLSDPSAKFTMDTPGDWELSVQRGTGPYWIIGLTDDGNRIVGVEDVRREYAFNPVSADEDTDGLELVMDLPCNADGTDGGGPGGWGGNVGGWGGGGGGGGNEGNPNDPGNITTFSGQIILNDLVNSDIMVTANNEDGTVGPIEWKFLQGAGAWTLDVANNRSATHLLAYHDTDGNGLFEPSDAIGEPPSNPFLLGIGDVPGVNIEIPSGTGTLPEPPVYVGVQGTVEMANFPGGTIRLFASAGSPQGTTFSNATLSTPGAFALSAPTDAGLVMVWAILDEDSDGMWDANVPFDSYGPFTVPGNGIAGISLDLGEVSLPNSVGGSVSYPGEVGPDDILFVALFDNGNAEGEPAYVERITFPEFPVEYLIEGVEDGVWYPSALFDVNGDSVENGPGPDDVYQWYGQGINLTGGEFQDNINFNLFP